VEIADGEQIWHTPQVGANLVPNLQPAVERRAEERELGFRHAFVLQAQVGVDDLQMLREPLLILLRSLDDVHGFVGNAG
jgi:hypothetical protein